MTRYIAIILILTLLNVSFALAIDIYRGRELFLDDLGTIIYFLIILISISGLIIGLPLWLLLKKCRLQDNVAAVVGVGTVAGSFWAIAGWLGHEALTWEFANDGHLTVIEGKERVARIFVVAFAGAINGFVAALTWVRLTAAGWDENYDG